ncbi:DUF1349 domain-containing protein [Streptomyces sp. N2-109]|uniref:DUF1349 domain-containing protein n=1 Tax=Streptomyces gossypii TaxID=2883101 RepID=A0ABT2JQ12_9ACTN|nr:DUF1349 domain-containing protein [Streptomyces gossypii]MCT2589956.1 DUF1349 domain-containing protein [Streptomyces gossypii]
MSDVTGGAAAPDAAPDAGADAGAASATGSPAPYRSSVQGARDGFPQLLLAEWTKLRSVPRWALTMAAAVVLTILVALITAGGANADHAGGDGETNARASVLRDDQDRGHLVHRPLTGDGTLVARVTAQKNSDPWAKAGLMLKESNQTGASYAAVVRTPDHGVRMQTGFSGDTTGTARGADAPLPRWLKLTRAGDSVTGHVSADGADWHRIGTVELGGLPRTVKVGLFVGSPDDVEVTRQFGGEAVEGRPTDGKATFDQVRVEGQAGGPQSVPWRDRERTAGHAGGGFTQADGTFTVTGTGDIGRDEFVDDLTRDTLSGVLIGLMAVVALGVLFITAEYRRGMIRTTFTASPRRGRVLAAKAVVIGAATFAAGLVASFGAFLLAAPVLRSGGRQPVPLSEGPVLRAVLGTALLLAVIAVFSLAVGALLRHSAAAITTVLLLVLLPLIVATGLPLSAATWLERLTPAAGFAIQQTVHRYDTVIDPWAGLGVLCGYTVIALALAARRLRTRDA